MSSQTEYVSIRKHRLRSPTSSGRASLTRYRSAFKKLSSVSRPLCSPRYSAHMAMEKHSWVPRIPSTISIMLRSRRTSLPRRQACIQLQIYVNKCRLQVVENFNGPSVRHIYRPSSNPPTSGHNQFVRSVMGDTIINCSISSLNISYHP